MPGLQSMVPSKGSRQVQDYVEKKKAQLERAKQIRDARDGAIAGPSYIEAKAPERLDNEEAPSRNQSAVLPSRQKSFGVPVASTPSSAASGSEGLSKGRSRSASSSVFEAACSSSNGATNESRNGSSAGQPGTVASQLSLLKRKHPVLMARKNSQNAGQPNGSSGHKDYAMERLDNEPPVPTAYVNRTKSHPSSSSLSRVMEPPPTRTNNVRVQPQRDGDDGHNGYRPVNVAGRSNSSSRVTTPARTPPNDLRFADPAPDADPGEREQCPSCGRMFGPLALQKHAPVCHKVFQSKRKVFDSTKARVAGTEAAQFVRGGGGGTAQRQGHRAVGAANRKGRWKLEHEAFIANIRAAKAYQTELAQQKQMHTPTQGAARGGASGRGGGRKGSATAGGAGGAPHRAKASGPPPPPAPQLPDDRVECETCGRRFSEQAYERHSQHCKDIINKPKPLMRRPPAFPVPPPRQPSLKPSSGPQKTRP